MRVLSQCLFLVLFYLNAISAQTYHSIRIDGEKGDWDAATTASKGSDQSTWFFSWNETMFFYAVEAIDIGTRSQTTFLGLYLDADPKLNPLDGEGTNVGKTYDYHTARLPFAADFYIEWLVGWDKVSLYYWEPRSQAWLATPADIVYEHRLNFIEVGIPMSWITNPSRLYACGALVRSGIQDVIYDFTPYQEGGGDEFIIKHYWGFPIIAGIYTNFEGLIDAYATFTLQAGDFYTNFLWSSNEVPDKDSTVYIRHPIVASTEFTVKNLLFIEKGSLNMTDLSYIQISNGGSIGCTSHGAIPSVGTVEFLGNGKIVRNCPITFSNLVVKGTLDPGPNTRIINTLKMMGNAAIVKNSPLYLQYSNLIYCSGGVLDRGMEWSAMHGNGYPFNVVITSGTTVNLGTFNPYLNVGVGSMLVITAGSVLHMDTPGFPQESPLYINENLQNEGTIVLSSHESANIYVDGKIHKRGNITCHGKASLYDQHKSAFNKPKISVIPVGGSARIPQGGNVTLDAGAGYDNYLWSPNAYVSRNRTVVVTNTGFYTVIVQSQGCVAESDKFEVIVYGASSSIITGLYPTQPLDSSSADHTLALTLGIGIALLMFFGVCVGGVVYVLQMRKGPREVNKAETQALAGSI